MKQSTRILTIGVFVLALQSLEPIAGAQTTYTWKNTSTTWGHVSSSNVPDNWSVTGKYPGLSTRGNGGGANTDIAEIALAGALTPTTSLQLNFSSSGNGVGAQLTIGAFVYDPSTGTGNTEFFGVNSSTSGTLAFTGVTYGGNNNVVISNTAAGQGTLTIQPANSSTGVLSLQLAGGVNTVVSGVGSGSTFGNTTAITTVINNGASASSIVFLGNGDSAGTNRGGTLSLGGTSNFTGGITVGNADGTQAGRVRIAAAAALPTTGNFTVNPNSQLRLDLAGGTSYGATTQTLNLSSLGAAAASATNISNGGLRLDPAAAGAATFNPAVNVTGNSAIDAETGNTLTLAGVVSGSASLSKAGAGTVTFTNGNTYAGVLTVNAGTASAASTSAKSLGSVQQVTVNSTGTLLLATANQVNTAAPVTLNAGAVSLANSASHGTGATVSGGVANGTSTVGLGALTLAANSTLNYLANAATAVFMSFDPTNSGAGTFVLNVTGGNFGTATASADGANNRLVFDQDIQAAGFLNNITFNGVSGATEMSLGDGFYEIIAPVPEPATVFGGLLLVGVLGWNQRRRLGGLAGSLRSAHVA